LAYPPFAGFISYTPQNPYTQPDFVPDGYELPPFYVNGKDSAHDLPNYNKGDIIVNFGAINLEVGLELENAPQIVLCLEGSGVVELKLLSIAQGGVVVLTVDNPPDIFDILAGIISDDLLIVDLNQDIISLPPETATEIIQELTIETEGEHNVYITFLPILDDSLIPLRFGGGLRAVDLCGNIRPCGTPAPAPPPPLEGVTELKPEFQFTADCGMEYRLRDQEDNIVQDWQIVPGWTDNAAACFGAFMSIDYDAMMEAIAAGIYKAGNNFAKQIVSGGTTNFSVGEDGTVTVGSGDEDGGAVDDPETPQNEASEARAGGAKAVTLGYNKIWADVLEWKNDSLTADVISFRLQAKYLMVDDAATDNFVALYFAIFGTGHVNSYTEDLSEMLFCDGVSKQTVSAYVIESVTDILQENALALNAALSDAQIEAWYSAGTQIPSTAFIEYSCVPIPFEQFTLDFALSNIPGYNTNGIWKQNHRMLVEIEGTYADSDVPDVVGDGMYFHNTSTGVKTFSNMNFNSSGVVNPVQAQVPFAADHKYRFTLDKTGADQLCSITRDNGSMNLPNVTGTITVKITDLGEFA
jgi:hypothetical protein